MGTTPNDLTKNKQDNDSKDHESDNNKLTSDYKEDTTRLLNEQNNTFNAGESTKKYTFESGESDKLYKNKKDILDEQRYEFDATNELKIGDQKLQSKQLDFTHEENMGFLDSINKSTEATTDFTKTMVTNSNYNVEGVKDMMNNPTPYSGKGGTKV